MFENLEKRKKCARIETQLPFFIRTVGIFMQMGMPFEKALKLATKGEKLDEIDSIVEDIENGITVQKAFASMAIRHDSHLIKRAMAQLISSYEIGSSGKELIKTADEMLASQHHKMKEFASKNAILGLVFIMTAALAPTFFLIYAVLGRYTLGVEIDEMGIVLGLLVVFPLISMLILLLGKTIVPDSQFNRTSDMKDYAVIVPASALVISFLILRDGMLVIAIIANMIATGVLLITKYSNEKKIEEIEGHLPDALFSIASLPPSTKPERIFEIITNAKYGSLSAEAEKSKKQLESNIKISAVLEDLSKRNDSRILTRVAIMLEQVFSTNSFGIMTMLADDVSGYLEVKKQRADLLSMQKYTLLMGGIIVPLILKISIGLMGDIASFFPSAGDGIIGFALLAIPAYITVYATMSSIYIAEIEGEGSKSARYFFIMLVGGLLTFYLINL